MKKLVSLVCLLMFFCALNVSAQTLMEQGLEQFKEENYEEALDLFLKAREAEPASSSLAYFIGVTYKRMEMYDKSIPYLKDSITLQPRIKEGLIELIDALYQVNDLKEADKWIAFGEKEGLSSGRLQFQKALVLMKRDKNLEAVRALEEAKKLDPELAQAAEFQIATALFKEGKSKEARERFRVAMQLDPKSDIATYAKDYEKFISEKLEREQPWRFFVGLGYKYDTNVVTAPSGGPAAEVPTGRSDSAINTTARVGYTAPFSFNKPYFLTAQYSLYVDRYFKNINDIVSQSIMVMPGCNFSRFSISMPVIYSYTWLRSNPDTQGGWGSFNWGDKRYMHMTGASPTLRYMLTQSNVLELSCGYQKKRFLQDLMPGQTAQDDSRDADNNTITVGWQYFTPFKGVLNVRYSYINESAQGTNWSYYDNRFSVALVQPVLRPNLKLQLSGDVDLIRYENPNTVAVARPDLFPESRRKDETYSFTVGVTCEFIKNWEANASWTYTDNDSNFTDLYKYRRQITYVGLAYNF